MSDAPVSRPYPSIDALLWPDDGRVTMHDAELRKIAIDYVASTARLVLNVCVGDPESSDVHKREARRLGTLVIDGLCEFSIEPPATDRTMAGRGLWIDAELGDPSDNATAAQDHTCPSSSDAPVRFWIYVNDSNSFMRVACKRVRFVWSADADAADKARP